KIVTQVVEFIPHREYPSLIGLCFLGHVIIAFTRGEHIKARPQKIIDPDRAFRSHHLIPQIQTAPEGPAHLKLTDGSIFIPHQSDGVILRIDRFDLGIRPAHDFYRPDVFSDITPANLNAMATEVQDTPPTSELFVPEPLRMRSRVRFPASGPQNISQRSIF